MKFKFLGFGAALAGAVAIAGVAAAQPHGVGWGHGPMEFLRGLNLTEDQKAQMRQIEKASWESMKPLMKQDHDLHEQEISALLAAGTVTADQMQPILEKEAALRTQIDSARMSTMIQLRSVLTAEQLAEAATKHTELEQLHAQEHEVMGAPN